jgi:hypothetical protein
MKPYAAINLHPNNGVLSVIDAQDHAVFERRLPNGQTSQSGGGDLRHSGSSSSSGAGSMTAPDRI